MVIKTVHVPPKWRKTVREAIDFFSRKVIKKITRDRIDLITVKFLPAKKFPAGDDAYCEVVGFDDNYKPDQFLITINKDECVDIEHLVATIMHEMTHVWQFATNRLRTNVVKGKDRAIFNGKHYYYDRMPYWLYPWEIEAHGLQHGMSSMFWLREGVLNPTVPTIHDAVGEDRPREDKSLISEGK